MFTNPRDNCVHKPLSILAPPIVITALITPSNYTVPYNSSFKAELILQGLPIYNPDFKIVDWRTEITSTIEGEVFVDFEDGYLKLTAQYNLFKCANTGIHRAVLQLKDYSQFEYELPIPLIISGKLKFSLTPRRADFHFFHRRGGKILGRVQVICHMPFLMLWKGQEMANQSVPAGRNEILVGSNTFWRVLRNVLGGLTPPPTPSPQKIRPCFQSILIVANLNSVRYQYLIFSDISIIFTLFLCRSRPSTNYFGNRNFTIHVTTNLECKSLQFRVS